MRVISAFALAVLATMLLSIAPASAQAQPQPARRSGQWFIFDATHGPGCTISPTDRALAATRPETVVVVLSYDPPTRKFLFLLSSESWNFRPDETYDIGLRFEGGAALRLRLPASRSNGRIVLFDFERDRGQLLNEFATRATLAIDHGGRSIGVVALDGGAPAIAALLDCQARHEGFARPRAAAPQPPPQSSPPAAPPAPAQSPSGGRRVWKALDNWTVSISGGYDSCSLDNLARGSDTGLELDWLQDKFLMIARNPAWTDFAAQTSHDITLRFYPGGTHQTRGRAAKLGSVPVFGWSALGQAFFDDFARASRLSIEHQGKVIGSVDLAGSTAALREKEACDRAWAPKKPPPLLPPALPPQAAPQAAPPAGPAREADPPSETNPLR